MNRKPAKKRGLDREHKDITCAVRLPRTMYERLSDFAKEENSSLSDIIRDALLDKMSKMEDLKMERELKEARHKAEMRKLTSGT